MRISSQEEYGLRCLMRLARAGQGGALTIPEIAAGEGLSVPHAAKLLAILRQAGMVESVRGRAGGYRLALPAEQVGLGAVLLALGEPLFDDPGYCDRHAGTETGGCVHLEACSLRGLWRTLEGWLRWALDGLTLADLLHSEGDVAELLRARLAEAGRQGAPTPTALPLLGVGAEPAPAEGAGAVNRTTRTRKPPRGAGTLP